MNILFINHYAGSEYHGMVYRHYYLARSMVKEGHKVTIIASSESHMRHTNPIIDNGCNLEMIDGIQYIWLKTIPYVGNGLSRIKNMFHFTWLLYKYRKYIIQNSNPDYIIDCNSYLFTFYALQILKKESNAKLLFEVRDLWPQTLIDIGGYSKYHPFIIFLQKTEDYIYKYADKVVSALPATKEHMIKHGLADDKFVYIPNGIVPYDIENNIGNHSLPILHFNLLSSIHKKYSHIVGYTGAHSQANAIDIFLKTALDLKEKNIAFVFVGDGNNKVNFVSYAKKHQIDNAYFLPPVKKNEIPLILEYFDIGLVGGKVRNVHKYGVCPNKLMDYMYFGLPVLLAIKTKYSPIHSSNGGLVVDPTNQENITKGIIELLSKSKKEKIIIGENAKKYIQDNHDYTILASKYINLLGKI